MEDDGNHPKRHIRLSSGYYRSDEFNQIMAQTQKLTELLMYYIDFIRNYRVFTEDMLETIKGLDDYSKMILIYEYNKVIKSVNILFA
jgi:hypothetical protein